jgi:DNA gyrase subunit A
MAYAASRYTEVKLDEICREIFKDIDKNVVDMVDNYNATMLEPVLLPTTFPNLLITPNQGIAVGMASTVCSFNLREICQTTIQFLKNPNHNLHKTLPAPDFSTGGDLVYNEQEIDMIYQTGRGSFKLRARYRFDKKNSCIEIYEIPYTTTAEAIIDKIAALVKANKIRDINDVRDETDLHGLKITIDIKKSADADLIMQRLYSLTSLQDTFSCNFNFLVDSKPRTMGIKEILTEWTRFRIGCLQRQLDTDIKNKTEKLHLLEGLSKILLDIDKAIRIIRQTESESQVIPNLMNGFKITQPQAEFIAEIRLRNLNKEYLLGRVNERDYLKNDIKELTAIRNNDERIRALIGEQLKEIAKKYGKERRTQIVRVQDAPLPQEDVFIEDYNIKLFLTAHNYFKKISLVSLRSSAEQYLKDDDTIIQEIESTNRAEILFFSNRHAVYKMKAYDLPDCKASALGEYLTNVLGLADGERIIYIVNANGYKGYMVFGFENGKVAKVAFDGYATKTNRKKLVNAYSDKSNLVSAAYIAEDCDFYLVRGKDKALTFNTALITPNTSKSSSGVQVFTLRKNTFLTEMRMAMEDEKDEYFRVNKIPSTGHFIK